MFFWTHDRRIVRRRKALRKALKVFKSRESCFSWDSRDDFYVEVTVLEILICILGWPAWKEGSLNPWPDFLQKTAVVFMYQVPHEAHLVKPCNHPDQVWTITESILAWNWTPCLCYVSKWWSLFTVSHCFQEGTQKCHHIFNFFQHKFIFIQEALRFSHAGEYLLKLLLFLTL